MESVGRLAGGVAHDLNNLLTPIIGYGEMLQQGLTHDDDRRQSVDEMLRAGHRARDLVRQLLAFSRKQILNVQPVDLGQVLGEFENLLRQTLPESVTLAIVPADGPRPVMADAGQLEQVILNLAVNAAHAMPDGGTLTLASSVVELADEPAATGPDLAPGPYVRLVISDTWSGMTPDVVEKIFEPFFSTKGEQGTGLGLAMAYGIVRQHGGGIRVDSEPGRGTTFVIHLPANAAPAQTEDPAPRTVAVSAGSETVLIVEDDEQVGRLARTILERGGFTVLLVHDGAAALEHLATHEGPIDLLLSDVIMPGLNGKELYEQAVQHRPELAVLYMSGYTDSIIADRGILDGAVHFIQKPFSAQDLVARVRDVLDS
jgi:CheY-like chemotaxis protein